MTWARQFNGNITVKEGFLGGWGISSSIATIQLIHPAVRYLNTACPAPPVTYSCGGHACWGRLAILLTFFHVLSYMSSFFFFNFK